MSSQGDVKQLRKRFDKLAGAVQRIVKHEDGGANRGHAAVLSIRAAMGRVDGAVRRLEGASGGLASKPLVLELELAFDVLWDELGNLEVWSVPEGGHRPATARSLLKAVEGPAIRLKGSLASLETEFSTAGPLSGPVLRLRETLAKLDKKAARGLRLEDLHSWCARFPEVRWDDPEECRRVARVVLLDMVPGQLWEVRYRSTAPGRPLLLVRQSVSFPDEESLDDCDQACGSRSNYYVAATRPRWRIVWTFSRASG
ncbi:MAG: hypothetical protein Q8P22_07960 [Chloroflexota bacterium]|nr:hypothetical protein [Chloroflexota bacterium]